MGCGCSYMPPPGVGGPPYPEQGAKVGKIMGTGTTGGTPTLAASCAAAHAAPAAAEAYAAA